jgi:hypothetical protein
MSPEIATPEVLEAAEQRVAAFLDEVGRLGFGAFAQTALSTADPGEVRASARTEADRIARSVGLDAVAAEARAQVCAHILRMYDEALFRPTMVGLNWGLSEGTVEDRIATVGAAEDAVTAAVIEPYLTDEAFQQLTSPFELITRGQAIDASFDLTRATARAVGDRGPAWWTSGAAIVVLVLLVMAIAFAGWWPIAVVVVLGAAAAARYRSRDASEAPTD